MSKRIVLLGVAVGMAAVFIAERELPSRTNEANPPHTTTPLAATDAALPSSTNTSLPPLPGSLENSDIDGELVLGPDSHFVPNARALVLFDYFLSATGEESDDAIRTRIVAHIRKTLPPEAAAEAEAFLDQYLAYRERMRELTTSGAPPEDLERRLQWIREERRRSFGAELAETLFGEEERVALADLDRRRILQDGSLTPEEKARRLEEVEARLPEKVRDARRRAAAPMRVENQVAALRIAGASEEEIRAVREKEFGPEAAQRLAALDHERAAWQLRVATYAALRNQLLENPALTPEERTAQIERLRAESFDAQEQLRIRALDEAPPVTR